MKVSKVILHNYRNYADATVAFDAGLNIIEGANTAGKTNLVEAVYLCSVGKSPRTPKDKDLVKMGTGEGHITLWVSKRYRNHRIDIHIQSNGVKKVAIDGVGISKLAELMGVLNVIYFSPDELKIVKEDPAERRRFINISLCQQNKNYFATLSKYNKILEQRNTLLKDYRGSTRAQRPTADRGSAQGADNANLGAGNMPPIDNANSYDQLVAMMDIWDQQLAKEGAKLVLMRRNYITALSTLADPIHRAIAGEGCDLTLGYDTQCTGEDYDSVRQALLVRLRNSLPHDLNVRYTLVGPHRDDISIVSEGIELRNFGSQGQQRTAALALKLAEIAYFEHSTGEKPVLLLDDVLSELDINRRTALLRATQGIQTLLTCTDYTDEGATIGKRIHVVKGTIASQ